MEWEDMMECDGCFPRPKEWLTVFEHLCIKDNMLPNRALQYAKAFLCGQAEMWLCLHEDRNKKMNTWEGFCDAFVKRFCGEWEEYECALVDENTTHMTRNEITIVDANSMLETPSQQQMITNGIKIEQPTGKTECEQQLCSGESSPCERLDKCDGELMQEDIVSGCVAKMSITDSTKKEVQVNETAATKNLPIQEFTFQQCTKSLGEEDHTAMIKGDNIQQYNIPAKRIHALHANLIGILQWSMGKAQHYGSAINKASEFTVRCCEFQRQLTAFSTGQDLFYLCVLFVFDDYG